MKLNIDVQFLTIVTIVTMVRANGLARNDCIESYSATVNGILKEYNDNMQDCNNNANTGRNIANEKASQQYNELEETTSSACGAVAACEDAELESVQLIYECYIKASSDSSNTLKSVSSDAKKNSAELEEALRRVNSALNICMTQSKIQYDTDLADAQDELNDCIFGSMVIPTIPPVSANGNQKSVS